MQTSADCRSRVDGDTSAVYDWRKRWDLVSLRNVKSEEQARVSSGRLFHARVNKDINESLGQGFLLVFNSNYKFMMHHLTTTHDQVRSTSNQGMTLRRSLLHNKPLTMWVRHAVPVMTIAGQCSSCYDHCESSSCSFNECKTGPRSGRQPSQQAYRLGP